VDSRVQPRASSTTKPVGVTLVGLLISSPGGRADKLLALDAAAADVGDTEAADEGDLEDSEEEGALDEEVKKNFVDGM